MLDIFKGDAFSTTALTDFVNEIAYRPSRIAELGLFTTSGVTKTAVSIERIGDIVQLVKPTPRGGPGETRDQPKRSMLQLGIPHFQRDWSVMADQVQGIRAAGSETQLQTVQQIVGQEVSSNIADMDLTEEHARLGAIGGVVTYADGETLNLFNAFDRDAPADVAFDVTASDGTLRETCTNIIRAMRAQLGGVPFASIHALVGDEFFDALLKSAEVRETYKGHSEASFLRESYVGPNRGANPIYEFGGIVFENYGEIQDEGVGVDPGTARFFPLGVNGLFRTYYAPADYIETVNTLGKRLYAKQWQMKNDKGIDGELQMNSLNICTRPNTLMSGSIS